MERKLLTIAIVLMAGLQFGCNEDDPQPNFGDVEIESIPVDVTGRWDTQNSLTGLIFDDTLNGNEFIIKDASTLVTTEYLITGKTDTTLTGQVIEYTSNYYLTNVLPVIINAATVRTGSFDAVITGNAMSLTITFAVNETTNLARNNNVITRDYLYSDINNILPVTTGVWSGLTENRDPVALSIDVETGTVDGSDSSGCVYNGTLKDANANDISVLLTITGCQSAGDYHGNLQSLSSNSAVLGLINDNPQNVKLMFLNN